MGLNAPSSWLSSAPAQCVLLSGVLRQPPSNIHLFCSLATDTSVVSVIPGLRNISCWYASGLLRFCFLFFLLFFRCFAVPNVLFLVSRLPWYHVRYSQTARLCTIARSPSSLQSSCSVSLTTHSVSTLCSFVTIWQAPVYVCTFVICFAQWLYLVLLYICLHMSPCAASILSSFFCSVFSLVADTVRLTPASY